MPLVRSVQTVDTGVNRFTRTITVTPLTESKVRPIRIKKLDDFQNGKELLQMILGSVLAHEAYYKAGILHGHIDLETVMIKEDIMGKRTGVLIDLDPSDDFRRPERPQPQPQPRGPEGLVDPLAASTAKEREREQEE